MKRIVIAAILAVCTLAACVVARSVTKYETRRIIEAMQVIDGSLERGDIPLAKRTSEAFLNDWEEIHSTLCTLLKHDHLDALESVFAVLPYYIQEGETALARAECKTVISLTEHIDRTERLAPENIL